MRRVLIDHARQRAAKKRPFGRNVPFEECEKLPVISSDASAADIITLHDALAELTRLQPRIGRVVELVFFCGFSLDEVSCLLGVSPKTTQRDLRSAKAWIAARLRDGGGV